MNKIKENVSAATEKVKDAVGMNKPPHHNTGSNMMGNNGSSYESGNSSFETGHTSNDYGSTDNSMAGSGRYNNENDNYGNDGRSTMDKVKDSVGMGNNNQHGNTQRDDYNRPSYGTNDNSYGTGNTAYANEPSTTDKIKSAVGMQPSSGHATGYNGGITGGTDAYGDGHGSTMDKVKDTFGIGHNNNQSENLRREY